LIEAAPMLNELDAYAGDGDLGITMSNAARAVVEILPAMEGKSPEETLRSCGTVIAQRAPSTAGTLVASGFLRAARAASESNSADAKALFRALDAARAGIAERGKAEPGSKTMLDAIAPAVHAVSACDAELMSLRACLDAAASAAEAGALATVDMRPRYGRA